MATRAIQWTGGDRLKRVLRELEGKLKPGAVQVGFFEGEKYTPVHPLRGTKRKPLPVAQVAFWNNFGTKRMPARPFFTSAVAAEATHFGRRVEALAKATNYDSPRMLALLGESMQRAVVKSIVAWSQPPNSPKTVKIKGFNKPLIDDGTMQRAVAYEVRMGAPTT